MDISTGRYNKKQIEWTNPQRFSQRVSHEPGAHALSVRTENI